MPHNIKYSGDYELKQHYIYPGEAAKEGDYKFVVIGDQDVALFIEAMLRKQVVVNCLREITPNPFSPEKIFRFQVINVET